MLGRRKARLPARPQFPSPHSPSPVPLPSASPEPHPLRLRLAPSLLPLPFTHPHCRASDTPPHTFAPRPRPLRYHVPGLPLLHLSPPWTPSSCLSAASRHVPPFGSLHRPSPTHPTLTVPLASPTSRFHGPREAPHFVSKHPAPPQTRPPRAVRAGCQRSQLTLQGQWVGGPQGLHLDSGAAPLMSHCSPQVTELGHEGIRACGLCSFQRSCALEGCTQGMGTGSTSLGLGELWSKAGSARLCLEPGALPAFLF